jgi:hypothetical protein
MMNTLRSMLLALAAALPAAGPAPAAESLCAEVKIELSQELTLERQGFEARMRIRNGSASLVIGQVDVDVTFADADGAPVAATTNAANTNALFFFQLEKMENVSAIDGSGEVPSSTTAEIVWRIVPAPGAGGVSALGTRYLVGATLSYTLGGVAQTLAVIPDYIFVKPMPELFLDYFLPDQVYSDDAFTVPIEPPVPFSLGVRARNQGFGVAKTLRIDTGQPRIVENQLGLLIQFVITGSEVNGRAAPASLLVDFGDLPAARAGTARWVMETSLSGEFKDFTADFSHADELGGQLTSLIDGIATHLHVRDVLVDLPGRDAVRDFLARDGTTYKVYESDNVDTVVTNRSAASTWSLLGQSGLRRTYRLTVPPTAGPLFVTKTNELGEAEGLYVVSAVRDDGKSLRLDNAWMSKRRETGNDPWEHAFNLFDANGGGTYTVVLEGLYAVPQPPVLGFVGNKVAAAGQPPGFGFLVEATDANGTVPALASTPLPAGATFSVITNGLVAEGTFQWSPGTNQVGVHPVLFTASDGALADEELVKLYVGLPGEPVNPQGIPVSLTNWSPRILDVLAASTLATATVRWESVAGVPYDVYYSDHAFSPTMTWHSVTAGLRAVSAAQEAADAALGTNRSLRFYQVEIAGDPPTRREVWGVARRRATGGAYTMLSVPLRMDRRFDGRLGAALAAALAGDDGGPGDNRGDELAIRPPGGAWRVLYLDAARVWREADGSPSVYTLPDGAGFFLSRAGAGDAWITFTGAVGHDGTRTNRIAEGWNIVGLSEGIARGLQETFAGGSAGGPAGGASEEAGDLVAVQQSNGTWRRYLFVQGWGAPFDGKWVDLDSGQIANPVLGPGQAYYYFRRAGAGSMEVPF